MENGLNKCQLPPTFERCTPIYEDVPGWQTPTTHCTTWEELPEKAKAYVNYLEQITGTPVSILSVGPKRSSTILRSE